jgi:DNA invertase Pin-like site-specific DNA recombinase
MYNTVTQPKAVIFLRDPSQADCRQAADALVAQVIREYVEDRYGTGIHGIDKRPALRLMLDELLASRDTNYVIATSPSRLTRRADVMATILLKIEAAGATLIFSQP